MLLAVEFKTEYLVDLFVIFGIMVWALIDGKKGFINCFFSFISATVCAIAVIFLSGPVLRLTGGLFGLEGMIQEGLGNVLCNIPMGDIDISSEGWRTQLDALALPQFLKDSVLEEINALTSGIPEGTLLGTFIGSSVGSFLAMGVCGIVVFIVAKILMSLTKGLFNSIANSCGFIARINVIGGVLAGTFKAFALLCIVLAVLSIIPIESISAFIDNTLIIKYLYHNNPLMAVFSWFTKK